MDPVTDNPEKQRFERMESGKLAFADYRIDGGTCVLIHVEAHPELRGRGAAGRLITGVLQHLRARGLSVRPLCGYAAAWIRRHPEWHDLLE